MAVIYVTISDRMYNFNLDKWYNDELFLTQSKFKILEIE